MLSAGSLCGSEMRGMMQKHVSKGFSMLPLRIVKISRNQTLSSSDKMAKRYKDGGWRRFFTLER